MDWLSRKLDGAKTQADGGSPAQADVIANANKSCAVGEGQDGVEAGRNESAGEAALEETAPGETVYRTYKRRWFGLVQLVLLNVVVSWDVRSPVSLSYP
ncbi:hypothetical protein IMZ48_48825 [Candidatus Bathyarchaeota archaeon]|nr:hypothetical protein [Candidatus Bathyarchaeota archaeon]